MMTRATIALLLLSPLDEVMMSFAEAVESLIYMVVMLHSPSFSIHGYQRPRMSLTLAQAAIDIDQAVIGGNRA